MYDIYLSLKRRDVVLLSGDPPSILFLYPHLQGWGSLRLSGARLSRKRQITKVNETLQIKMWHNYWSYWSKSNTYTCSCSTCCKS